jgi:hypothetical protein
MKKKTHKAYEQYLNEFYADSYAWSEVQDNFGHWKVRERTLLNAHNNHMLGTLHRKCDSIGFYAGYNDWAIK